VICHEICRDRLSPEMQFIIVKHLEHCAECRRRIFSFLSILEDEKIVRNYG
jgi:hypothetical protein